MYEVLEKGAASDRESLLVDRCLAKVPAARFQSAQEVRTRLETFLMQARLKVGMLELSGFVSELSGTPLATAEVAPTAGLDGTEGSVTSGTGDTSEEAVPTELHSVPFIPPEPLAGAGNDDTLLGRLMEQARRRLKRFR